MNDSSSSFTDSSTIVIAAVQFPENSPTLFHCESPQLLQKNDITAAITRTDIFDFLVGIVPRDEIKEEPVIGGMVSPAASGLPYYYHPPMGQPTGPGGMMIGRPTIDPSGVYAQPLSQAWQNVWPTSATGDDVSYCSGGSSGQGNLDGQS